MPQQRPLLQQIRPNVPAAMAGILAAAPEQAFCRYQENEQGVKRIAQHFKLGKSQSELDFVDVRSKSLH
jgi:hypothetical protein